MINYNNVNSKTVFPIIYSYTNYHDVTVQRFKVDISSMKKIHNNVPNFTVTIII